MRSVRLTPIVIMPDAMIERRRSTAAAMIVGASLCGGKASVVAEMKEGDINSTRVSVARRLRFWLGWTRARQTNGAARIASAARVPITVTVHETSGELSALSPQYECTVTEIPEHSVKVTVI